MNVKRFDWDGADPIGLAGEIRALQPSLGEVGASVAEIIAEVRTGGEDALLAIEKRLAGGTPPSEADYPTVSPSALETATSTLDPELQRALELAAANVRAVAEAQLGTDQELTLEQGQTVTLREVPVRSAGIYAPGGVGSYPSTVLMGCIPAKVAGVERVVLATPPGRNGLPIPDVVLAAAAIAGADQVYAMGGAQAIAALALGAGSVSSVDVIAGPGNRYVQEAKRQLAGEVGIDGIAGPSELMVIAGDTADPAKLALDLGAQAEHGPDGLLVAAAVESALLDRIEQAAIKGGLTEEAPLALVALPDTESALTLANAIAPEHLEIDTEDADLLARGVSTAGCVFVGEASATAFGDYAAGSNHVLPTGGAGRFQGPLGPSTFRRRISTVELTAEAARELAPVVATLARAEGFPIHAESVEARAKE